MMWGVNFGQWPSYVVEKLNVQGRRPPQYNIIGKKIEQLVSSYTANDFDMKFAPKEGNVDSLTHILQDMYYSDKHHMKWKSSRRIALRDMHNMVGYERMTISDKNSDFGNIAFEPVSPSHIYLDVGWRSPDVDDIRHYFDWGMYTPTEICDMFPNASSELEVAKEREELTGIDMGEYFGGIPYYRNSDVKWGDRHKVITYHWYEKEDRMWEYDLKNHCPFPETGFKPNSDQDIAAKRQYAEMMGLDLNFDITMTKQKKRTKYVQAICPTLNAEIFLANGKDKIQTNNCNIYPLGDSYNGQFKGTTDELYDLQISLNKDEMIIDDIQMRTGKGAFILDEALTGNDRQRRDEIEQQWNDPAARIWVEEGTTKDLGPNGGIIPIPYAPVSQDLFRQADRKYELADWLSVPAAMDARGQSSSESGKLFQSKVQVGLLSQKYGMEIYEMHETSKAMAYARQVKYTYSGIPRTFHPPAGGSPIIVNRRNSDNTATFDDISALPSMLVTAVPNKKGINYRTDVRDQSNEVLQFLQDPQDRLAKLIFLQALIETYDIDDEEKEESKKAFAILKQNAALQQAVLYKQMSMQLAPPQAKNLPPQGGEAVSGPEEPQQVSMGVASPEEEGRMGTPQEDEFTQSLSPAQKGA
jgi:hypothetical protein